MTTTHASGAADLPEALINIAREIEALKRDCGMDPESSIAIQNGRYMAISSKIRALAAGQATAAQPAAQQPHRSGCAAGSDEECVQRGCGTNCPAVSPRQGVAYAALPTSSHAGRVYEEGFLIGTCPLYTADQMRAFADATHMLRGWIGLSKTFFTGK